MRGNKEIWHWFWETLGRWYNFLRSVPYILHRERVVMIVSHLFTESCLPERDKLIRGRDGRRLEYPPIPLVPANFTINHLISGTEG